MYCLGLCVFYVCVLDRVGGKDGHITPSITSLQNHCPSLSPDLFPLCYLPYALDATGNGTPFDGLDRQPQALFWVFRLQQSCLEEGLLL